MKYYIIINNNLLDCFKSVLFKLNKNYFKIHSRLECFWNRFFFFILFKVFDANFHILNTIHNIKFISYFCIQENYLILISYVNQLFIGTEFCTSTLRNSVFQ